MKNWNSRDRLYYRIYRQLLSGPNLCVCVFFKLVKASASDVQCEDWEKMTLFLSHDTPTSRSPRALLALVRCSPEKRR